MSYRNSYEQQGIQRKKCTDVIVKSTCKNKIIVAGPGTGKSFTFKELLQTKEGNNLALTFINNLATDLQKELGELSESYTFHKYCKKLLHQLSVGDINSQFHYFPKLCKIVESDSQLLGRNLKDFEDAFHILAEDEKVDFFLQRGNFYNATGYADSVYRVLKYFQFHPEKLPQFSQIVVDEYQDFNPLEVAFIDELLKASPVLIVGDDDQAIYDFKNASPKHIREKFHSENFVKFELPYCSRCTQVIVDSVQDITTKAQSLNKLQDRIEKPYYCFLPDKQRESIQYPKIIHASCSTHTSSRAPYISKFIEKEIDSIPQEEIHKAREENYPCVLILGPSHYTKQIYDYLEPRLSNVDFSEKKDEGIDILDGYRLLIENEESNLGWRIVLESCCDCVDKENIVRETYRDNKDIIEVIQEELKSSHLEIVSNLKKLKNGDELSDLEKRKVICACGRSIEDIEKYLRIESEEGEPSEESIFVKITTINGSKGLSANYVFLVGMNNTVFPKTTDPTDNEIRQLIVGITRTRKKCYLISNSRFGATCGLQQSIFVDWIKPSRVHHIEVNREFFQLHPHNSAG